jgi:hypothetical protein
MTRAELEQSISTSADALVRAALKEIDRMIRNGDSPEEILAALQTFRLPPAEAAKLKRVLDAAFDEILIARGSVVDELIDADINLVKSAAALSFPKLKRDLVKGLIPTVQRAIANEEGPQALKHQLRLLKVSQPETLALTSLSQFNNGLTIATAEVTLTNKFLWDGPAANQVTSHELCKRNAGKIFTLAELDAMDNGCGLPVRLALGGYRCRHHLTAQADA